MHAVNLSRSRFACAIVIWWPLSLVSPDAFGPVEGWEPEPQAAITVAVASAAAARRTVEVDLNMPQVVSDGWSHECYKRTVAKRKKAIRVAVISL
jgi:hypothetical protein